MTWRDENPYADLPSIAYAYDSEVQNYCRCRWAKRYFRNDPTAIMPADPVGLSRHLMRRCPQIAGQLSGWTDTQMVIGDYDADEAATYTSLGIDERDRIIRELSEAWSEAVPRANKLGRAEPAAPAAHRAALEGQLVAEEVKSASNRP